MRHCHLCNAGLSGKPHDTVLFPSFSFALDALGEDPEVSMPLCGTCGFALSIMRQASWHCSSSGCTDDTLLIYHLYGCLIDGRVKNLPSWMRDPQAQKLIVSALCEVHNNAVRL